MSDLTADRHVRAREGDTVDIPMAANTEIFAGALVHCQTGYATHGGDDSGGIFAGVAVEHSDNNPGDAGAKTIKVARVGKHLLTGSGFAQTDLGKLVYNGADDGLISLVGGVSNNVVVGQIVEFVSATQVWVDISRRAV